jgi:N-acetylmuramic acid 6-phosphate etherase
MQLYKELQNLTTESVALSSADIDQVPIEQQLQIINSEDATVTDVIRQNLEQITPIVIAAINVLKRGGRIIYVGAGTSGRMGVIDAVECYPTYGLDNEIIIGLIAGGNGAVFKSVEGAEDSPELAKNDLQNIRLSKEDIVIGIAASGRTPYVLGAINYANEIGAISVGFSCNKNSAIGQIARLKLDIEVGAEVIAGSTRMKAGTCQKLVLNMISTVVMINLGKVYKNFMVDVKSSNKKLTARIINIFIEATGSDEIAAYDYLELANGNLKVAITMYLLKCDMTTALVKLDEADGKIINLTI